MEVELTQTFSAEPACECLQRTDAELRERENSEVDITFIDYRAQHLSLWFKEQTNRKQKANGTCDKICSIPPIVDGVPKKI